MKLGIYIKMILLVYLLVNQIIAQFDPLQEENNFYREKGYTLLYGEQNGDYESNVYLVTDDIIIEKGENLTFHPGAVILFKKNTRIQVKGSLICQGTKKGAVTLKKLDNSKYFYELEPELPALWHGIEVSEQGQVEISHTYIKNSKTGITANATPRLIIFDNIKFNENRYHNLKIGDNIIPTPDNVFISFNSTKKPYAVVTPSGNKRAKKKMQRNWKLPVRIILGTVSIAGAAMAGYYHYKANDYKKEYKNSNDTPTTDKLREDTKRTRLIGNIGIGVSAVGAVGFTITIPIGIKGEA